MAAPVFAHVIVIAVGFTTRLEAEGPETVRVTTMALSGAEVPVLERFTVVVAVLLPGVMGRLLQSAAACTVNVTGTPAVAVPEGVKGFGVSQTAGAAGPVVFRAKTVPPAAVEVTEMVCAGPGYQTPALFTHATFNVAGATRPEVVAVTEVFTVDPTSPTTVVPGTVVVPEM